MAQIIRAAAATGPLLLRAGPALPRILQEGLFSRFFSISSFDANKTPEPAKWWRSGDERAAQAGLENAVEANQASSANDASENRSETQRTGESEHSKARWWLRMDKASLQDEAAETASRNGEVRWHPGTISSTDAAAVEAKPQTLAELRRQYAKEVSSLRKQFFNELEAERMKKAKEDAARRQEIQKAKELRLKLKKERSEIRAREVQEERRILQEQLAKERSEKLSLRQDKERLLEAKRQKERDIIRQESPHWIEEKELEVKIIEALANPVEL